METPRLTMMLEPEVLDRLIGEFEANTRAMRDTRRASNHYVDAPMTEVAALREAHDRCR